MFLHNRNIYFPIIKQEIAYGKFCCLNFCFWCLNSCLEHTSGKKNLALLNQNEKYLNISKLKTVLLLLLLNRFSCVWLYATLEMETPQNLNALLSLFLLKKNKLNAVIISVVFKNQFFVITIPTVFITKEKKNLLLWGKNSFFYRKQICLGWFLPASFRHMCVF